MFPGRRDCIGSQSQRNALIRAKRAQIKISHRFSSVFDLGFEARGDGKYMPFFRNAFCGNERLNAMMCNFKAARVRQEIYISLKGYLCARKERICKIGSFEHISVRHKLLSALECRCQFRKLCFEGGTPEICR